MPTINLDPKKLLGFKIIAKGESSGTLRSPKIGGKGCPSIASDESASALRAKIGTKTD